MEERMSTENFPRLHGPDCEQSTDQRKWRFFMMNHCHLDFSNRFFCLAFFSKISFCIAYYDNQQPFTLDSSPDRRMHGDRAERRMGLRS